MGWGGVFRSMYVLGRHGRSILSEDLVESRVHTCHEVQDYVYIVGKKKIHRVSIGAVCELLQSCWHQD